MRSASGRKSGGMTLGLGYGTFGTWKPQVQLSKALGNWDFLGSYNLEKSDGYRNTDLATGIYLFKNNIPWRRGLAGVHVDPFLKLDLSRPRREGARW